MNAIRSGSPTLTIYASQGLTTHEARALLEPPHGPRTPLTPRATLLQKCAAARKADGTWLVAGCIRFNASRTGQQLITPNIVTLAAVLDAIPLQDGDPLAAQLPLIFDAVEVFKGYSAMQATEYMHKHYGNQTSSMAMVNPGFDVHGPSKTNPLLTKSLEPGLIDYNPRQREAV